MSCMTYIAGDSVIHRLDPRVKILVTICFTFSTALSNNFIVLGSLFIVALILAFWAHLPVRLVIKRLLRLNLFMLLLWFVLPFTTPGAAVFYLHSWALSEAGIWLSLAITVKGNTIVLFYTTLLGTVELSVLGHALAQLKIPAKLTHLFLFTIRYVDVFHHEYERLSRALKTRCFQPGFNSHTYRTYGYLVALLLTRSLDRAERVLAAMKCRGYQGKFYILTRFAMRSSDLLFGVVSGFIFFILIWIEIS
ncbi:cobalt ECF transporter T component CbiQ [candidate division CSSED10-310 bacterium]|uniref:Cobalt ECF transporter T component CbiQ n=1 Tax=candidate division CSSED10-310 bacterium TaxID=2855610 RepID=A0ABV6YR48_UNCC1